jgi:hypothetical protein
MADDKVFRQERRPITPAELGETQQTFNKISEIQKQIDPDFKSPVTSGTNLPQNMPEHLKEAIRQAESRTGPVQSQNLDPERPLPPDMPLAFREALMKQSRPGPAPYNPETAIVTGSAKLQELREKVKQASYTYEEIQLPSMGKFYDGVDGPKNGLIHVRPMTGHEEEILATPRLVKRGNAINTIFNRCIQEEYDSDKFLTEDRTYLLIYLRGISYGTNYEVEVKCPECTRTSPYTINLHELYVDNCPEDYDFSKLSDILPTTQLPFAFRLSRGDDEIRVQDYREKRLRTGQEISTQTDDTLLYRTSLLLEDLGGLKNKHEIQMLLKDLPINDVAYLRNIINEPPFGVDTNAEVICPRCYNEFSIDLPLEASFFFPRAKTNKVTKSQSQNQAPD